MSDSVFTFTPGPAPLLISMPHVGTDIPDALRARMTPEALALQDTDWHLPLLYDFAQALGASLLQARCSRYVVDLNRPPDNANLYPGQDTTGLCPTDTFACAPLYRPGMAPDAAETAERRETYWRPYHTQLQNELERLRTMHGRVVLWDAHSIASVVPRFFEGRLPDFNLGSADGTSCTPELAQRVHALAVATQAEGYSAVLNGRFKGGYITRHYGQPERGIHALQMEMAQCIYMNEAPPFAYRPDLAARVRPALQRMLQACLDFAEGGQRG